MLELYADMLELLENHPAKFQQYFINQQLPTATLEASAAQKLGKQFHLVMQQLLMDLPIKSILCEYPNIARWVNFLEPIVASSGHKQAGIWLQKLWGEVLVITSIDLLIINDDKYLIIDWTTQSHLPTLADFTNSWEVQLKLFLLAETRQILPKNISLLTYFVNVDTVPIICKVNYSYKKYNSFKRRLETIIASLSSDFCHTDGNESLLSHQLENHELHLQKFLAGELSTQQYLDSIPEVEI